jgi:endonuclease-3
MTATTQRAARGSKLRPAEIVDLFTRLRELESRTRPPSWSTRTPFELLVAVVLSAQATDVGVNKATRKIVPVAPIPRGRSWLWARTR